MLYNFKEKILKMYITNNNYRIYEQRLLYLTYFLILSYNYSLSLTHLDHRSLENKMRCYVVDSVLILNCKYIWPVI